MALPQQPAQYGAKKQLADIGLGQKDVPTNTGAVRAVRHTGRPQGSTQTTPSTAQPQGPPPQGPTPAEHQAVVNFAVAQHAKNAADQWASTPTAGPWAQLLQQMGQSAHEHALLLANHTLPNFNPEL